MKKFIAGMSMGLLLLALAGCTTSESQLSDLRSAIDEGKNCPELFPLLKAISSSEVASEEAQAEMRKIGCFSISSERTDAQRGAVDPDSAWIGVPGGESVDVSEACETPAARAAQVIGSDAAEALIKKTLENCSTVNEWLSALETYPGLMGMVDGYIPSVTDVQVACINYPASTVCNDAEKIGL
ncbi:hypothetical protein [Glutamicibacter sp.]|uniref:hypothetical protein n=1 Tax=Glutamicibacter sp. TaxID=1931995 RepID=UPI003D6B6CA5